jgi:hypothetical protein
VYKLQGSNDAELRYYDACEGSKVICSLLVHSKKDRVIVSGRPDLGRFKTMPEAVAAFKAKPGSSSQRASRVD